MTGALKEEAGRAVLVINPNTTKAMTDSLEEMVRGLKINGEYDFFTASEGVPSINDEVDAHKSMVACIPDLTEKLLKRYVGFIVACYSDHPLVGWLQEQPVVSESNKVVLGIMQASVFKSWKVLHDGQKFGIVSTGKVWEALLTDAVEKMSPSRAKELFAGVTTTGLNAKELHDLPSDQVESKMKDATRRLLRKGNIGAICLGCAGMVGMDRTVRSACVAELGEEVGGRVNIIDGVVAAVEQVEQMF